VTTHIIGDIERIADDVAIINKGKIMTYACLEDLREQVCEIHVSDGGLPEGIASRVELLGTKKTADGMTFWVKCDAVGEDELKDLVGPKTVVRHVDLQTYYLAITENGLV
jgi:ABC-type multidrug transport system ATPase subunit